MPHIVYRILPFGPTFAPTFILALVLAFILTLALPPTHAAAASFFLTDDAVIDVKEFAFPAKTGAAAERNLPAAFHSQLVFALQKAGFRVIHSGEEADLAEPAQPAPLTVTPLNKTDEVGETPEKPEEAAGTLPPAPGAAGEDAPPAGGEKNEAAPIPLETPPDTSLEAPLDAPLLETPKETPQESPLEAPAPPAPRRVVTHILEGRVTLFRESVGTPSRIGGSIRIRTEAQIHCAYKIKDATNGKVLISDVASGSAARITAEPHDIDATLERLSAKAMNTAAATIAAHLAGTDMPGDGMPSDRGYYQDSPGKQLKPKAQ